MVQILPKITKLNGKNLYFLFLAGSKKILENQMEINRINVFPVPDADTGTNLASTIRSVIDNIKPDYSFKVTVDKIAIAALEGARGNSGIIFAQFLYGLSAETGDHPEMSLQNFSETLKRSTRYVYDAIANPVEGTMLTVIREWVDHIHDKKDKLECFRDLLYDSYKAAKRSLGETTKKLKVLAKANVVDAGAKGFVLFLEGIMEYLNKDNVKEVLELSQMLVAAEPHMEDISKETLTYRFCTEALIKGENLDKNLIKNRVLEYGDSVVVAGSTRQLRLHVHTDHPADLFETLRGMGTITQQKADDMYLQYQIAHERKYNIALVTDSTCDLPGELLDQYQIHQVPINIHVGESIYLDKLTLDPETFYTLSEESPEIPTTSQPNEKNFVNLYSHLATHYDSVIAIHISGKFSGTWSSSSKAAKRVESELNKKISVIDSKTISGSLGLLVLRTAEAIERGLDHDVILRKIDEWIAKEKLYVSVKTLHNLVRSGRVNPLTGWVAKVLNLKPIISVGEDGKAIMMDKAFSQEGNIKKVLNHIRKDISEGKLWNYMIVHALNPEGAEKLANTLRKITGRSPRFVSVVCSALVLHAGNGTVAVGLVKE